MGHNIDLPNDGCVLESGAILHGDHIRARLYGPAGKPVIVVLGGISASRYVADAPDQSGVAYGWWTPFIAEGGPVDLNNFQVLGLDFAPGPGADDLSSSITTNDQAMRLGILLAHLNIKKLAAIIGSSYGGMVALAFAEKFPDQVDALCVISAAHQPYPMGVAWRGIQRRIVRMAIKAGQAEEGLKLARELAMTTYRSAEEFTVRFDGSKTGTDPQRFDVCDYLNACGNKFTNTMPAARFLALSESLDLHRIEPERITTPTMLIASRSDQLVPPDQMQALCDRLGGPAELTIIDSLFGHDAFLKETEALGSLLTQFTHEKCNAR